MEVTITNFGLASPAPQKDQTPPGCARAQPYGTTSARALTANNGHGPEGDYMDDEIATGDEDQHTEATGYYDQGDDKADAEGDTDDESFEIGKFQGISPMVGVQDASK
jgi:hypothetical protein